MIYTHREFYYSEVSQLYQDREETKQEANSSMLFVDFSLLFLLEWRLSFLMFIYIQKNLLKQEAEKITWKFLVLFQLFWEIVSILFLVLSFCQLYQ